MARRDKGVGVHPFGEYFVSFGFIRAISSVKRSSAKVISSVSSSIHTADRPFETIDCFIGFRGGGNDSDIARFDDGVEVASDCEPHVSDRFESDNRLDSVASR